MIELIERTLLDGGDLEVTRQALLNQATEERLRRTYEIEHDCKIATLIRECLATEPRGSAGYCCAKGVLARIREKYADPEGGRLVRSIHRDMKREERREMKKRNDTAEGTESAVTGTETIV